ncbi:MAG: bifunctional phosphoribosylaminoimidazolecarboxamide formyltransferase/IMP cyclohydrolase, partial [Deltaproteobacteria bacterium]|nr:bifunctional phosphoribosylaminoimidazolecarboxamide formyltransferase/IMP cyclohydrolase [Deltaproteobacteria bacterium]
MESGPKTALISVYDKSGLENFARRLKKLQFKIISTGNTAQFLRDHGIEVTEVSEYTGFPEILGGRVKTLHPKIHGGILGRGMDYGQRTTDNGPTGEIDPIELVVVNLYPFESTPTIENIDIGGPTMLRGAAKNYESVTAVCNPADYDRVAGALEKGDVSLEMRKELAGKVFALTARYEKAIAEFFGQQTTDNGQWTNNENKDFRSVVRQLRYGENPHQRASFHKADDAELFWNPPLQGKELSYNN